MDRTGKAETSDGSDRRGLGPRPSRPKTYTKVSTTYKQ